VGRRLVIVSLLVVAVVALVRSPDANAAPAAPAVASAVKLESSARADVLRDGLVFRQAIRQPGFVSWEARLAPAPSAGRIAAHTNGPLVTAVFTREIAVAGRQDVTLPLTVEGARLVRARKLARLIIRTTVDDGFGGRTTTVRSVTLRTS
jgi:hypothetical protein